MKKALLLVFVLMFVMALAACSSKDDKKATEETPAATQAPAEEATPEPVVNKDPVTIRVGTLDSPEEKKNAEAVGEILKKTHPWITIKVEPYVGDYKTKALAQAASGDLPDVTWIYDGAVKEFAEAGVIAPLNDIFAANGVDVSDVYESMLGYGTLEIDGKVDNYYAPRDYNHIVMFVNKTLLKQEGLDVPADGWDWATFMDYMKKLTKKDAAGKTTQFGVHFEPTWAPNWVACTKGMGGKYVADDNKSVRFSDPAVVAGLKLCWDLVKNGYATDPAGQYPEDPFMAGKVGFKVGVKPHAPSVNDASKAKGFEWDVVTMPRQPVLYAVGSGASGYAVSAKSKYKEAAGAYVSLFLKVEGQNAFNATGAGVPVLKSLKDDKIWRENPAPGKNMDAMVAFPESDVLRDFEIRLPVAAISEINAGIPDAFTKYILNQSSLEDALQAVDDKVNALLK